MERQSGMGISPKTETHCRNFSFFENLVFENLDGRKTRNCGSAFQFFWKCPYLIGAPRAIRRFKCHLLGYRFSVPSRSRKSARPNFKYDDSLSKHYWWNSRLPFYFSVFSLCLTYIIEACDEVSLLRTHNSADYARYMDTPCTFFFARLNSET